MDERQQGASAPSAAGASASTSATVTPWQGQSSRPLADEVPAGQIHQAGKTAAPIVPLVSSSSSSSSLAAAMPSPSPRTDMPSPSMMPPALTTSSSNGNGQKPKSAPEKRVLPARLRRVSALLGGESLDDANSPGGREESPFQRSLPDSTILVISRRDQDAVGAHEAPADEEGLDSLNFFQDPKMVMACREKALIETPDFKLREDSSQMGKTRGGAMRSEEDTSDAAYERRHRRPDNLEKKQRRMEKERLIKERQRLRDRIEQLKTADPRMLMPIMSARESQLPSSSTTASSLRGAEAAIGLGKQHMSAEATNNLNKIEKLRKELIAETTETLARYDAVLSVAVPVVEASTPTAAAAGTSSSSSSSSRSKTTKAGSPSTSTSAATKRRASSSGGASTPPPRKPRTSSSSAASPSLLSEPEIMVKAENEHRNIHARTSGGRFAPRSAVIDPNDPEAGYKPARKPRPSEIAKRAQKEAERQARAAGLLPPKKRGTSKGKGGAAGSPGAMDAATMAAAAAALQARAANRVGPSLAEIDTAERRPKRVRLLLGQRPGTETEDDDSQEAAAAAAAAAAPRFAAPGALSLEQAQKMMMAAMAAARGGPAADAAGEAANNEAAEGAPQAEEAKEATKSESGATDAVNETNKPAAAAASTAESVQPEQATAAPKEPDTTMDSATGAPSTTVDSTTIDGVLTTSSTASTVDASAAPIEPIPSTSTATTTTDSTTPATTETQTYRRTSSRVRGAFGEKLPQRAFQQEDFEAVLVREGVVQVEISVAERGQQQAGEQQKGEQGGDIAMEDAEKGKEAEVGKVEGSGAQQQVAAAPQPEVAPHHTTEPSTATLPAQPPAATSSSADLMDVDEYVNADAFHAADQ